jgi:hypothetical protein
MASVGSYRNLQVSKNYLCLCGVRLPICRRMNSAKWRFHKSEIKQTQLQDFKCVKFLQSHPPITETFRFCLIVYLYNMFQPSTGSSSGTNKLNYQKWRGFQIHLFHFRGRKRKVSVMTHGQIQSRLCGSWIFFIK